MKVLLTGCNGQLGRELTKQLTACQTDFVGYDIPDFDITDKKAMAEIIEKEKPSVIINCGAMTNVDGCETHREAAMKVNGEGPGKLAEIARDQDITLVHVSTDYVFDGNGIEENGKKRPYVETDAIDPKTVYGESKALGEKLVAQTAPKHFIIRTAWLYGDGKNFVKTMLGLADTHPELTVVDDQVGSPTSTVDLARAILALIQTQQYGLYHGTCEGQCSWCDFAKAIFELSGKPVHVVPVTSEEYPSDTPRPKYSVLENAGLKGLGINAFRPWKESLVEYLKRLENQEV
ncbi:MAG: dTDP-4-dehydrorhamnose reductase [Eubacteriaceae bacterium]|jgi:dTDP-4-dehydrorhamnose reductase|nr:dTDP-4-dehydrorhamnose reductase [Eubacteriaceae bacterium]MDD4507440.1 dTDP-4-dehydrorhamnose reductase [Eubacteriaceae bacterium]